MAAITQQDTRLKLQFVANTDHSIHAGLVAVEAMARRFDLWHKLRQLACLDPRKDKKRGFGPEVIVGQLLYALCSGGGCLSDREALNDNPLARERFGVGQFADQSQVGEWLREQSEESVAALRRLLHEFVAWVWKENGDAHHAFLRHQPAGRNAPQLFAVSRRRDGLFDHYGFIACDDAQTDAARVGERHHLKGDKEQLFGEVLNGLDLHRPPGAALIANQIYHLIAALAYDLMVAIKLLDLTDDCQGWRVKPLMKKMVRLPGRLAWRSQQWVARVRVPGAWLCRWQRWEERV